mmetsp:Transcript_21897/g.32140  ORF Transcript_21897/g.32140 Transcript_21897/m.32140 type:complete len:93 (-) Transcript_21897:491-769(-)
MCECVRTYTCIYTYMHMNIYIQIQTTTDDKMCPKKNANNRRTPPTTMLENEKTTFQLLKALVPNTPLCVTEHGRFPSKPALSQKTRMLSAQH